MSRRLRLPSGDHVRLPSGRILALPGRLGGRSGLWLSMGGVPVDPTRQWSIERPAGVAATLTAEIEGRALSVVPTDGAEVVARDGGPRGWVLFGGYIDAPRFRMSSGGVLSATAKAIGWRKRLGDRILSQVEGLAVAAAATAAEQVRLLVGYLAGEGFTVTVDLPVRDVRLAADVRFERVADVLDELAKLNDTVLVVRPDKHVIFRARARVLGVQTLTWPDIASIGLEGSRQDYRTRQIVRGGQLVRIEKLPGRADGRYRLGGTQNLNPGVGFFDAPVGGGILWTDTRERGGAGRGSGLSAVLVQSSDAQDWPAAAVTGSDRRVDSLRLEALAATLGAHDANRTTSYWDTNPPGENRGTIATPTVNRVISGLGTILRLERHYDFGTRRFTNDLRVRFGHSSSSPAPSVATVVAAGWNIGVRYNNVNYYAPIRNVSGFAVVTLPAFNWGSISDNDAVVFTFFVGDRVPADSFGLVVAGVSVSDAAKRNYRIAARASDGTEYIWSLAGLANGRVSVADLGFLDVSAVRDAIGKLRAGESVLVLLDATASRVDLDNRRLRPAGGLTEIEVVSLESVQIGGVEQSVGGDADPWLWRVDLQQLQERVPRSPAPERVDVQYKGRYIVSASFGQVLRVDRVVVAEEVASPAAGIVFARADINRHRIARQTLVVELRPGASELEIEEGDGVNIAQGVLDAVQIEDARESDVWRVDRVSIKPSGLRLGWSLRLLRRADESRFRDRWRPVLRDNPARSGG